MELWIARDKTGYIGLYYEKPIWRKNNSGTMDWVGILWGIYQSNHSPK